METMKKGLVFIIVLAGVLYFTPTCQARGISYFYAPSDEVLPFPSDDLHWSPFKEGDAIYPIVADKHLEIRADGSQTGFAGIVWNTSIPITGNDHGLAIRVDFDSEACSSGAMMGVAIANASTDMNQFDEFIAIVNGQNTQSGMVNRSWGALSFMGGNLIDSTIEETDTTSGYFYIFYADSKFHIGDTLPSWIDNPDGSVTVQDPFASFSVDGWTACDEVLIKVFGWSDKQALSGDGSFIESISIDVFAFANGGTSIGKFFYDQIFFDVSGTWVGKDRYGKEFKITITQEGIFLTASTPFGEYSGTTGVNRDLLLTGPGEYGTEMKWYLVLSEDGTELTGTYTDIIYEQEAGSGDLVFTKEVSDVIVPLPSLDATGGGGGGSGGCFIKTIETVR